MLENPQCHFCTNGLFPVRRSHTSSHLGDTASLLPPRRSSQLLAAVPGPPSPDSHGEGGFIQEEEPGEKISSHHPLQPQHLHPYSPPQAGSGLAPVLQPPRPPPEPVFLLHLAGVIHVSPTVAQQSPRRSPASWFPVLNAIAGCAQKENKKQTPLSHNPHTASIQAGGAPGRRRERSLWGRLPNSPR